MLSITIQKTEWQDHQKESPEGHTLYLKDYQQSEDFVTYIQEMCCRCLRNETGENYCCVPQSVRAKIKRLLCGDSSPPGCYTMSLAKRFPRFRKFVMSSSRTLKNILIFSENLNLESAGVLRMFSLSLCCKSPPYRNKMLPSTGFLWISIGLTTHMAHFNLETKPLLWFQK